MNHAKQEQEIQVTLLEVKSRGWLIFEGFVYDVADFINNHPGGAETIISHAGEDITDILKAEHPHSSYALDLLQDYRVGRLFQEDSAIKSSNKIFAAEEIIHEISLSSIMRAQKDANFLDATKPLVSQVLNANWTKEYYLEQVHIPRFVGQSPLFFANSRLNILTINKWWVVPAMWLPIIAALFNYSLGTVPLMLAVTLFICGFFLWTMYEYVFHRFAFHMESIMPNNQYAFLLHFTMHGIHHLYPMDANRLVMPPLLMIFLVLPVANLWHLFLAWDKTAVLIGGSLLGYVFYDMMHYYFHHGPSIGGYLAFMKKYHMDHHYVNPNLGFGVSNILWDLVFNTRLPPLTKTKKVN